MQEDQKDIFRKQIPPPMTMSHETDITISHPFVHPNPQQIPFKVLHINPELVQVMIIH